MLTFRRTKEGGWAVYGPASEMKLGRVTVSKRDGSTDTALVQRISNSFLVEGVSHVFGYIKAEVKSTSSTKSNSSSRIRPSNYGGRCRECRQAIRDAPHHKAMGGLCGDCAFDEYDC